ncbi:MAG: thiolase family protein [Thermodesulfobacteriota bacterium]
MKDVFIAGFARTPVGSFNGSLAAVPAVKLGAMAAAEAVKMAALDPADVEEVILGNVFTSGLGAMPARQAALGAGFPGSVRAALINNGFVSGLGSIIFAAEALASREADVVVAGGMENLSRVPYLVEKARFGLRLGSSELLDPIMKDCLWDEKNDFHVARGVENIARQMGIGRQEQDRYARQSYSRALEAQRKGLLEGEVMPMTIHIGRDRFASLNMDEGPQKFDPDGLAGHSPLLHDGTITTGNASFLADGAAAVVLVSGRAVKRLGIKPVARLAGFSSTGVASEMFSIASAGVIDTLLQKARLKKDEIRLFEINEDFAASSLAVIQQAQLDPEKVNVNGGSVAIGNPGGASGARLLVSLLSSMRRAGTGMGVAALGAPGGEAAAVVVEVEGE